MSDITSHIIIVDGKRKTGKKTFSLELSLALLYSSLRTAIIASENSEISQAISLRKKQNLLLPIPTLISRNDFYKQANNFDAIIIPSINSEDELAKYANTYITLVKNDIQNIQKFKKDIIYINEMWKLKKEIASNRKHTLNWVVCENTLSKKSTIQSSPILEQLSKRYGFRLATPINYRPTYQKTLKGISSQDKTSPKLQNLMTYDDICCKREINQLAEFIFNQ